MRQQRIRLLHLARLNDGFIAGGINDNGLFMSWTPDGFMPQNGPGTSLPATRP